MMREPFSFEKEKAFARTASASLHPAPRALRLRARALRKENHFRNIISVLSKLIADEK